MVLLRRGVVLLSLDILLSLDSREATRGEQRRREYIYIHTYTLNVCVCVCVCVRVCFSLYPSLSLSLCAYRYQENSAAFPAICSSSAVKKECPGSHFFLKKEYFLKESAQALIFKRAALYDMYHDMFTNSRDFT
jgi:hypothetical protein